MPHRPKSRGAILAIVGVPLLLVGYVLSCGPTKAWLTHRAWRMAYSPLVFTCRLFRPAEQALVEYVSRWDSWGIDHDEWGDSFND